MDMKYLVSEGNCRPVILMMTPRPSSAEGLGGRIDIPKIGLFSLCCQYPLASLTQRFDVRGLK